MRKIAERVIEKCGGPGRVAAMLGVDLSTVHRWKTPRERGGTGGIIPANRQHELIDGVRALGIELTPADFFDDDPEEPDAA